MNRALPLLTEGEIIIQYQAGTAVWLLAHRAGTGEHYIRSVLRHAGVALRTRAESLRMAADQGRLDSNQYRTDLLTLRRCPAPELPKRQAWGTERQAAPKIPMSQILEMYNASAGLAAISQAAGKSISWVRFVLSCAGVVVRRQRHFKASLLTEDEIVEGYVEGQKSMLELAMSSGRSDAWIRKVLLEAGVTLRTVQQANLLSATKRGSPWARRPKKAGTAKAGVAK